MAHDSEGWDVQSMTLGLCLCDLCVVFLIAVADPFQERPGKHKPQGFLASNHQGPPLSGPRLYPTSQRPHCTHHQHMTWRLGLQPLSSGATFHYSKDFLIPGSGKLGDPAHNSSATRNVLKILKCDFHFTSLLHPRWVSGPAVEAEAEYWGVRVLPRRLGSFALLLSLYHFRF